MSLTWMALPQAIFLFSTACLGWLLWLGSLSLQESSSVRGNKESFRIILSVKSAQSFNFLNLDGLIYGIRLALRIIRKGL